MHTEQTTKLLLDADTLETLVRDATTQANAAGRELEVAGVGARDALTHPSEIASSSEELARLSIDLRARAERARAASGFLDAAAERLLVASRLAERAVPVAPTPPTPEHQPRPTARASRRANR